MDRFEAWLLGFGYLGALVVALIGGIILNLMPCVLPVISLKILSFVRQADEDRSRILQLGLAYCAGILVFFGFIATLYWRAGTGWGQLFQRPRVILGLAAVVTAFALSLFGVFALFTPKVINRLGQKAEGEGAISAFSTGVLATFLGTACTAPFLSAALGAASKFPAAQGAGIFFTVGVGMALPFFALSARPGWLKYVPKPGPWMTTFEVIMGFLLLGTVVWLLYPLGGQLGDYGLLMAIIFLLAVATAAWIRGKIEFSAPPARKLKLNIAVAAVLILGWTVPFRWISTISELQADQAEREDLIARGALAKYGRSLDWSKGIPWQHYVPDLALQDVRNGYTIFIDYTARWCVNCKTNLKTSIDREETIQVMREQNVIPYEADYTNYAPAITRDLKRFGHDGVPLYLVYKPHDPDNPEILPIILTPQDVIDALKRAGPSRPTRQALAKRPKPGPKTAPSQ